MSTPENQADSLLWAFQSILTVANTSLIAGNQLAAAHSSHAIFVDLSDGTETYKRIMGSAGDGVACLSGHTVYDIFAYAENSTRSRVFIYEFPTLRQICILENAKKKFRRILCLAFSETEHLVLLTGNPDYEIEVWNWRTGKLLVAQTTGYVSDMQYIRCSRSFPLTVTQLAFNTGKILFWEIFAAIDTATLIKRTVRIPTNDLEGPFNFCYALDGSLYVASNLGTVWHAHPLSQKTTEIISFRKDNIKMTENEGTIAHTVSCHRIVDPECSAKHPFIPDVIICLYKGGLVKTEPDGSVRFYKKMTSDWQQLWTIHLEVPLIILQCIGQERVIGFEKLGHVVDLIDECDATPSFKTIKQQHRCIIHFGILNPLGELLAAINEFDQFLVLDIITAKQIAVLLIQNIEYMLVHPTYPIVALGSNCGIVYLVSIYEANSPNILTEFHLCTHRIIEMKFTPNGSTIVIFDESLHFFVITGGVGDKWSVTHHVNVQERVLSFTAQHFTGHLIINCITVPMIGIKIMKTNSFVIMNLEDDGKNTKRFATLPKEYIFLYELKDDQPNMFIAVSMGSHSLDIIKVDVDAKGVAAVDDCSVTILRSVLTEHQFCYIQIQMGDHFFISWGLGGRVFVWDKQSIEVVAEHTAQNYYVGGIRKAVMDPFRQYIVTLGNSGNLECVKMNDNAMDRDKFQKLQKELESIKFKTMFERTTIGYIPTGRDKGKTWVQIQSEQKLEEERQLYIQNREGILIDLQELKTKLKKLIDNNEVAPDDEKLPLEAFDLDKVGAHGLSVFAQLERDAVQSSITSESAALTKITNFIISTTWDLMEVKGKNVRGIFTRLKVENYALSHPDPKAVDDLQRAIMWRSSERPVSKHDVFHPWIPKDEPKEYEQLALSLAHRPTFTSAEVLLKKSASDVSGSQNPNPGCNAKCYVFSLSGTPSHEFIIPIPMRYTQFEVVTYHQMVAEIIMGFHDTLALRKYFNKIFDDMVAVKDNEMVLTRQRNARLRHIQGELNILEQLKNSSIRHNREINDPEYAPDETPESIVKVEANELSVTPYISPEEQRILDLAAAEAERRRLEMLADDFRERALIKMMDGVLEIRWEDEIKKTPPPPDCITSGKDPKDYTPEDLLAIHEHETELETLRSERERYQKMLLEEQAKTDQMMNEQVQKFNLKVGETLMEKMRVEFAICCEDMKLLRNEQFNFQRLRFSKNEAKFHQDIKDLRAEMEGLTVILNVFEDALLNCKSRYEELSAKDRALDKQFKSSFAEFAGQAVVDQAYRVFRRRPKWQMRAWQTAAILQDMARRVNAADLTVNGPPLPQDCFEYLQLIEQVDKFSNAPNLMDQSLWQILCKMRRVKIEIEFKVRSLGALMAEAEASVNAFVREINAKRAKVMQFEKKLEDLVEERNNHLIDRSVQLCMKRGQVEITITGRTSDFTNSVLLHAADVRDINAIIKKAGKKKLKTMENAAVFRRQIIFKEWEHKVLRMRIEEKKESIRVIENTKITKEVQLWLKWKKLGWKEDITEPALDREIEAARMSLESMCNDIIKKINDTDQLIAVKKRGNARLDKKIQHLNLDITELNLSRDLFYEERETQRKRERMQMLVQRSRLIRQVQKQHAKILELSTMLELQRLRTFPTLNLNAVNKAD